MSINASETGPIVRLTPGDTPADAAFAVVIGLEDPVPTPRPQRLLLEVSLDAVERDDTIAVFETLRPDGILLPDCRGRADLQAADIALGVIEAEAGLGAGSLSILAVFGTSPASFLGTERLSGASARLIALVLDEDALADALGLPGKAARSTSPAVIMARGYMILQAVSARVPCFWSLPSGETDGYALERLRDSALDHGFRNVLLRTAAQWVTLGQDSRAD
ncbi:hypothetical protein [Rhizobium sp. 9140]|uniref:hypothetical protein n=1 Tax=Rhizobium sp. 9140 TaxID=1761900 RepID=UPI00079572B6|nr:hypothetical protein [Rhizobium sp. 9140]CZT35032.1 hypothetical protein GA0004734_00020440 [Rhizobium sp. 9140]